ncbi:hypothetical protein GUJ93_ZPchr0012g19627 [Zizania palustris]|uniref:Uncharacterized protein n=1 Tax=Zizania palustris TaxID=103762 RepID=A0A8J5WR37_ZIZPA|nr:hypothetical protein GUJ93_ZPchr0012g19627 [Zizania palustris]
MRRTAMWVKASGEGDPMGTHLKEEVDARLATLSDSIGEVEVVWHIVSTKARHHVVVFPHLPLRVDRGDGGGSEGCGCVGGGGLVDGILETVLWDERVG